MFRHCVVKGHADRSFPAWDQYLCSDDAWGSKELRVEPEDIRAGCSPFLLVHGTGQPRDALVLLHGLTDSPWFMRAIAEVMHHQGGWMSMFRYFKATASGIRKG